MATITYCKGLPTPASEMNSLGFTELEMFLSSFAPVFHKAACETVDHLLSESKFNKSSWNTHLQKEYGILKRHANGVISFAKGLVDSASLEVTSLKLIPLSFSRDFSRFLQAVALVLTVAVGWTSLRWWLWGLRM